MKATPRPLSAIEPQQTAPAAALALPTPWWALGLLVAVAISWEWTGWDMALARAMGGGPAGFAWREHWLTTTVLHSGAKTLSWLLALVLTAAIAWPIGMLRQLPRVRRVQIAAGIWLSVLLVSALKSRSPASCPWDLSAFGGQAAWASHWDWLAAPLAGGRCFPAGHASSAFAFIGGWIALRSALPRQATRWLWAVIAAGAVLGLSQQWRGAHFMSHTLWTACVCMAVALVLDAAVGRWLQRRGPMLIPPTGPAGH